MKGQSCAAKQALRLHQLLGSDLMFWTLLRTLYYRQRRWACLYTACSSKLACEECLRCSSKVMTLLA